MLKRNSWYVYGSMVIATFTFSFRPFTNFLAQRAEPERHLTRNLDSLEVHKDEAQALNALLNRAHECTHEERLHRIHLNGVIVLSHSQLVGEAVIILSIRYSLLASRPTPDAKSQDPDIHPELVNYQLLIRELFPISF